MIVDLPETTGRGEPSPRHDPRGGRRGRPRPRAHPRDQRRERRRRGGDPGRERRVPRAPDARDRRRARAGRRRGGPPRWTRRSGWAATPARARSSCSASRAPPARTRRGSSPGCSCPTPRSSPGGRARTCPRSSPSRRSAASRSGGSPTPSAQPDPQLALDHLGADLPPGRQRLRVDPPDAVARACSPRRSTSRRTSRSSRSRCPAPSTPPRPSCSPRGCGSRSTCPSRWCCRTGPPGRAASTASGSSAPPARSTWSARSRTSRRCRSPASRGRTSRCPGAVCETAWRRSCGASTRTTSTGRCSRRDSAGWTAASPTSDRDWRTVTNERRVLVHPDMDALIAAVAARFLTKLTDLLDEYHERATSSSPAAPPGHRRAAGDRRLADARRDRLEPRPLLVGRRAVRAEGRPRPQRDAGPRGAARPHPVPPENIHALPAPGRGRRHRGGRRALRGGAAARTPTRRCGSPCPGSTSRSSASGRTGTSPRCSRSTTCASTTTARHRRDATRRSRRPSG